MFGKYVHPQLVDDLSVALCARFNLKAEPKDVARFINTFGYGEQDQDFVLSGFPIGKIESSEQFTEIQSAAAEKSQFFNVQTGRWMNSGNAKMVYGDGWCAKRNSPEHQAMLKIVADDDSDDELSITIDECDGWHVVEGTSYIFCKDKEKIVGRIKGGDPVTLTHKAIRCIKEAGYPYERIELEELEKLKLE